MDESEQARLVARVAAGDGEAFTPLYRLYLPLVLRWCLRQTGDRELAADLSSEVFAAALVSSPRYRPAAGSVAAWLIGIAANKLRESRRRSRIEDSARRKLGLRPVALVDSDLERVEQLVGMEDRIRELIGGLPADQRDALLERVVLERGYGEIAARMECSESVIRQRVSRGLRSLRSGMGKR